MIKVIQYKPNQKVLNEIQSIAKTKDSLHRIVDEASTLGEYLAPFLSSVNGKEFIDNTQFSPKSILDIGFGRGETSLYLASKGHRVISLEPSELNCKILEKLAKKFHLNITIYQGVAECIDQIQEDQLDVCIFNSSLHHCDDPIKAMKLCKQKLHSTGKILAINEPMLKFYQTKKRYFRKMEKNPVKMGHYGGNEHIYSYRGYINLFKKTGFKQVITHLHSRIKDPRETIHQDFGKKIEGQYMHSNQKLLVKFIILLMIEKGSGKGLFATFFLKVAKRLSILPITFEAQKL